MMRGWVVGGGERKKIASESKDHFDVSHHHWFLFFIDVYATSLFFLAISNMVSVMSSSCILCNTTHINSYLFQKCEDFHFAEQTKTTVNFLFDNG